LPPSATSALPSAPPASVAAKATVLRRLELDVTRRLDGLLTGDYLAISAGPGTERAGARPYEPGDDARLIDWSLTARTSSAHVRTTEADREMETWVVADRSASLDFGTTVHEKREVVLAAVAAFGFLSARHGNRFGILVSGGEGLTRIPARGGRMAVLTALSSLYDVPRQAGGPGAGSDLAGALATLDRTQRRRGQVVVVSDFLDTSDWRSAMRRLGLRHQTLAAHVTDPRELHLPAVGILGVIDPETGRRLHVQTNSAGLRTRYEAAAAARSEEIRRSLVGAGADYLHLSTDRDWLVDVARFIGGHGARRGAQARRMAVR
jgi:uncharacterized protein (DUF58 family)